MKRYQATFTSVEDEAYEVTTYICARTLVEAAQYAARDAESDWENMVVTAVVECGWE